MRRFILAMGTLALFACGDSTGVVQNVNGSYNLQTVNGFSLPFTFSLAGALTTQQITADVITASNGSFTDVTTERDTNTQTGAVSTFTTADTGTYTINGTAVTFTFFSDGSMGNGTISGNTFTMVAQGISLVYTHQ
jgi:hypothetical protein